MAYKDMKPVGSDRIDRPMGAERVGHAMPGYNEMECENLPTPAVGSSNDGSNPSIPDFPFASGKDMRHKGPMSSGADPMPGKPM